MNKKVLALAVAGALSAPAAALAQVTIGGGINILFYQHDPDNDSDSQTHDRMESSESEVRISGVEKLGGGLEAWFQCATSADGIVGGTTATARVMCTRNSALGLRGSFGNVFLGNWDTPMKLVQNQARGWFSGTNPLYGGSMILLAGDSQSGASNTGTSFYRRQANSVNYQSPNWSGFTVAAAFSASNESAAIPDSAGATPRLMSINGMYRTGPLLLAVAFEKHDDFDVFDTTDDAFSIVAGYRIGAFNIRAIYQENNYEVTPGGGATVETKGFGVYADWNIQGPHTLRFGYAKLDDVEGTAGACADAYCVGVVDTNTGGDWINVSYTYDFSKRTQFVLSYNQLKSDSNANFSLGVADNTLGGKQKSIGIALRHSF